MSNYKLTSDDRATIQYRVTTRLREAIIRGEFQSGERLVQEEWAERLGVSRMPIREALKQLEVEGLVRLEPRKGAVVLPISREDVEEIYEIRALLEGKAVAKSIEKLNSDDIEKLKYLVDQMEGTTLDEAGVEKYIPLNREFHELLRKGCNWRRIHSMIETLWRGLSVHTPTFLYNSLQYSHKEHRLIMDCVLQGNEKKLQEAVEQHILQTKDRLLSYMENNQQKQ